MYLGLMAGRNVINRLNAAGTTDTSKLVAAFEGYKYDAGKSQPAYFRKCDHQAVQETYAGTIVPASKRRSPNEYFVITSTVGGDYAALSCDTVDATAAAKVFASETPIPTREGYAAVSLKA